MTKASNGKGKGKAKSTPKPKKPGHCDHGKKDNGKLCAACYVAGTGGEGIRNPCIHGKADNGNRCLDCYQTGEGGAGICEHLTRRDRCKKGCESTEICKHKKNKQFCKEEGCGGSQICIHKRGKSKCPECNKPGEGHLCLHGRPRSACNEGDCHGSDYCEHNRQKTKCDEGGCNGSQRCEHGNQKYQCKDCDGSDICPHKKQKSACADCNNRFCTCCRVEKTSALDAMCKKCLSKVTGTSIEEIHIASMMCCALYGSPDRLSDVSLQKTNGDGTPFDMVFPDISEEGYVVVEHDSGYYHDSDASLERDTKKTLRGLADGCIVVRHRHVDCPKIRVEHDDFHVVEFNGYSSKGHSERLVVCIVEYMGSAGFLTDECMEKAYHFVTNSGEFEDVAKEHAIAFIRKMVLG